MRSIGRSSQRARHPRFSEFLLLFPLVFSCRIARAVVHSLSLVGNDYFEENALGELFNISTLAGFLLLVIYSPGQGGLAGLAAVRSREAAARRRAHWLRAWRRNAGGQRVRRACSPDGTRGSADFREDFRISGGMLTLGACLAQRIRDRTCKRRLSLSNICRIHVFPVSRNLIAIGRRICFHASAVTLLSRTATVGLPSGRFVVSFVQERLPWASIFTCPSSNPCWQQMPR